MGAYKSKYSRDQLVLFPTYLDDIIDKDNPIRVIDSFVDSLDTSGFLYSSPSNKGNKPYNPKDMLKLFLLGYKMGIRSSRKLMYNSRCNIEFIWLLKGVEPDFRSISDFRKNNIDLLKDVLVSFNLNCQSLNLLSNIVSQDGTKVKAVNSKENNYTLSKIDDRKASVQSKIDEYISEIDLIDQIEDKEEKLSKIQALKQKLEQLNILEQQMIDNNLTQISTTDPDSKLMPDNGKFSVSYNNQVVVDSKSHLVYDFELSNNPADLGQIHNVTKNIKDTYNLDSITNITDKGYVDRNDMVNCLMDGIIPEVTPTKGNDGFNLETDYIESNITDDMINSSNPDDLKACLSNGTIPSLYKDIISDIEVKEVNSSIELDPEEQSSSEDELRDYSIDHYCFTRHIASNKVFCPMGEILRQKAKKNNGYTSYCNKLACKNCKNPCCNNGFKIVLFSKSQTTVVCNESKNVKRKKKKTKKIKVKKVFIKTKSNFDLIKSRMSISEHPHASMKFWDNSRYLLLKGKRKATGELALYYCAYNIRRACNILGVSTLVEHFNNKNNIKIA